MPPSPPAPVPDDLATKIKGYFAGVTDPDKTATAVKIRKGYEATLQIATVTDPALLRMVQQWVDRSLLQNLNKTDSWKTWTDGMTALVATADLATTRAAYQAAVKVLAGELAAEQPAGSPRVDGKLNLTP